MLWPLRLRLPLVALALLFGLPALAQAGPPRSAIFFYPWYSNMRHDGGFTHWTQGGHLPPLDVASQFYPALGTDLAYLRKFGIRDVYVYRSTDFTAEDWLTVTDQPNGMRLFAQTGRV